VGEGLGQGTQKLFFLPEVHTDFIFPVIGEEMGFIGTVSVVLLYAALGATGWRIMSRTSSAFGHLLAFSLTLFIVFQAAFNLMVVTAMVPNKGIPLPFLSFGGSSLCFTLASVGILMNISNRSPAARPKPA
jgi:cell division protein FtsW